MAILIINSNTATIILIKMMLTRTLRFLLTLISVTTQYSEMRKENGIQTTIYQSIH